MVKQVRPDAWRGVEPRERVIKQALFGILKDVAEVERIFPISKRRANIDGHAIQTGRHCGGRVSEGHQERPSRRLSARRQGAHFRAVAHERRYYPRFRHLETWLDQATAKKISWPGTRDASRISRSRKSLCLGQALPTQDC